LREQRHQPGARYPAAPTTVNITALPIEPTALAFYAHELGFFSREGIDARITVINDPQQAPAAVLSGAAVFSSFSVSGLAVLKSRGAPVRLIAAGALYVPTVPTTAPVAAKGQRFKTAGDLVGKTIAIDAPKRPPTSACCDGSSGSGSRLRTFTSSTCRSRRWSAR
jgi:ABC-type nitrate/sulfonate/bicarbonate transport system substrate-binding protein